MEPVTVSSSRAQLSQIMMPEHANAAGNVHGGTIMKMIDNAALIAAQRHTRSNCVTASVDKIDFISPVFIGNLVTVLASVNLAERTSMEIGARVEAECMITGKKAHVGSAYLTFVALDAEDKPMPVPGLILENDEDKKRNADARARRESRLKSRSRHKHSLKDWLVRPEKLMTAMAGHK